MNRVSAFVALAWLLAAVPAVAQTSTDGTIRGHLRDEQGGVLPGVALSATSPTVPGTYTAISDGEGLYRILNLPPGQYTVTAELPGFSRFVRDGVYVRAGLNLTVDIVMKLGAVTETVEVKAETPMLETSNSVQAVNITGEFQRSVPITSRRNWSDVLSVAPGVVSAEGGIAGIAGYYFVRGAGNAQQKVAIDGADMGSSQQATTNQTSLSTEALADTQIKTGANDASSPLGFGASLNMVTKSGTNTLHGTASMTYQAMNWNANNVTGGTAPKEATSTPEVSLGGPIRKDRLWFFGAYRHQGRSLAIARTALELDTLKALYPSFEPFNNPDTGHFVFVKLTAQLGTHHQLNGYYQRDYNPNRAATPIDAEQFGSAKGGGPGWSTSLSSVWNAALTTRFSASYSAKSFERSFRSDRPGRPVFKSAFLSGGRLTGNTQVATLDNGNNGISLEQPNYKYTLSADATYYRRTRGGAHEIKAGFYAQPKIHAEINLVYANSGFAAEGLVLRDPNNLAGGTIPFWRTIYDDVSITSSNADTADYAFYLQDNWRPTSRLTVNAGVRVDLIHRTDNLFDLQTQKSTEVGPRFGVNYMVTKDLRN
ncbi:MAG: TonB-dependent receptor, partial [Planctomycetes bacterium]|nr:TonB-dependent receptor [Planctomycetota bacterium]